MKFNLDRLVSGKATIAADLAVVSSVEASGTHKVTLHLKYPSVGVLLALADRAGMMVSPTALERDPRANPHGERYRVVSRPSAACIHGIKLPIFGPIGLVGAMSASGERIDASAQARPD